MKNQKLEIVLEDFNLSEVQITALEKELHSVVAKHLIKIHPANTSIGRKTLKNPEWLGIWLKKFGSIQLINKAKTFKESRIDTLVQR